VCVCVCVCERERESERDINIYRLLAFVVHGAAAAVVVVGTRSAGTGVDVVAAAGLVPPASALVFDRRLGILFF